MTLHLISLIVRSFYATQQTIIKEKNDRKFCIIYNLQKVLNPELVAFVVDNTFSIKIHKCKL